MKMKHLWILIIIAWIMCIIKAETFEECEGVTMLTFVASSRDCSKYIFCDGEDSYEGDCDEGDYFNSLYQTCDAKEYVQCRFNSNSSNKNDQQTTTTTDIDMISETLESLEHDLKTTTITTTTMTSSIKPSTYEIVSNFIITSTSMPTTTSTTTTTQPLIWAVATAEEGETCPQIADPYRIFYIKNSKSCSDYFICYRGLSIKMQCSAMLHFNAATGTCDYPERAKCATDVFSSAKEQCQLYTIDNYYPHDSNCNYFYHCKSGFLLLEHCPLGYGWDYEKRLCTKINLAKCYNKRLQ